MMKTKWILPAITVWFCQLFISSPAAGHELTSIVRYHDENTALTVLRANVSLPIPGYWMTEQAQGAVASGLSDVFVSATPEAYALLSGQRMSQREEQQKIDQAAWPLSNFQWIIRNFAEKHEGRAPKSLDELGADLDENIRKQLTENFHMMNDLRIDPPQAIEKSRVIAFEKKPLVDDGKYWVLLSNGSTERRDIDPELAASVGVTIQPLKKPAQEAEAKLATYTIHARIREDKPTKIILKNSLTGQTTDIEIDPAKATPGERVTLGEWASRRMLAMPLGLEGMSSAILPHWYRQAPALYGFSPDSLVHNMGFSGRRQRGNTTGIFNVLGGRAAIEETLQMQDIVVQETPGNESASTPIADIKGVEVKSHPFEEMLGDKEGGRIKLAEVIPADRLFAYFPKPAGLISWLDGGAKFLFNAGSSATGRRLEYGLSERYIASLGMDREWMQRLLDSGAVEEIAIAMPDLFLIDGTELTTVARLKNPLIAAGLLKLIGIGNLDSTVARKAADGSVSHWAQRGDLLIVSSDAGELDKVLKLHASGGKDSLGRSAELRYMLTKLPLKDSTKAFVYLSDPFIRKLVGPATKIAQHRRMRARGEMEALVAGSLLHRLDGHDSGTPADLIRKNYLAAPSIATDAVLDPESGAVSKTFGALPRMNSLNDLAITTANAQETAAYGLYLENYNRFWQRFFDPIALRIDQPDPATYELSVFILPLIDNSIYNGVRQIVASEEGGPALKIPVIVPEPVATLSMNLREETWVDAGGEMLGDLANQVGLDTTLLDFLGPDIHVALADADPVLEMGSGEITNAFGPMDGREMLMIPAIVSMFTRPTTVCVGVSDPEAVRRALNNSVGRKTSNAFGGDEINGILYKATGRESWVYRISFFDLMTLRLGIEVQDRFLVIRNMPLTTPFQITGVREASQPGAQLSLSPRACRLQLPSLFASAAERQREAAFGGISSLQPLLLTGNGSIEEATAKHKSWFGFRPLHPAGGEWKWDGLQMSSDRYGSSGQPTQPDYQAGSREFGLLQKVDGASVSMRFEEDGLRTTARWDLRAVEK